MAPPQGQSTRKNTGQVAVKPLNRVHLSDVKAGAARFDRWLQKQTNGYVTLDRLKTVATSLPVLGNLIALVDVVNDVVVIVDKTVAKAEFGDWVTLGVDVIGIIPIPPTMAAARTTLRPTLFLVKEAKAAAKGVLSDTIIMVVSDAVNDALAGTIEKFATQAKAQLPGILNKCSAKVQELSFGVDNGLKRLATGKIFTNAGSNVNAAKKQLTTAANTSFIRNPSKFLENGLGALSNIAKAAVKTGGNAYAGAAMSVIPTQPILKLGTFIRSIGTAAPGQFQKLNDPKNLASIAGLIEILIGAIKIFKSKKKVAAVKTNQTTQAKSKKDSHVIEKQGHEAKPKSNACPCKNCPSGTKKSISFALGTEFITHIDANLNLPVDINLMRTYASNLYYMDDSEFGARWLTPFSLRIVVKQTEAEYKESAQNQKYPNPNINQTLELIYFDGRPITLNDLKVGEIHYQAVEQFYYSAVTEDFILVYFDDGTQLIFEKSDRYFRLSTMRWENNFSLGLNYHHIVDSQTFLSDIIIKHGEKDLAHIHSKINAQHQISELILLEVEDKARVLAAYQYNQTGDLICATNQDAHQYHYTYHKHLLTSYSDLTGRRMHLEWDGEDADARAYHEYADDGSDETRLQWDDQIRLTYVTNAHGDETWYYYDIDGYTYRTVYADGLEEWFFRDDAQNVTKHIATDGSVTLYDFDENSNLLQMTQADGTELYYGYDEGNHLTHFRDAEANIWQREYDQQGNLTADIDPLERKTQYQYSGMGLPVSIQDAKGGVKQLSYTAQGQLSKYIDCSGKATTWEYDERGRLIQTANALNEVTTYIYTQLGQHIYPEKDQNTLHNAVGQLEQIKYADGSIEHFIHDAEGRLLVHTDPKGQKTQYEYNVAGQISKRIDPLGQSLKYHWDKLGRLSKLSNENGASYYFYYDSVGRLLKETDFDGKETIYHYSETSGELQRSVELAQATQGHIPKHRVQAFEFDAMGRLIERTAGFSTQIEKIVLEEGDEQTLLEGRITEEFAYNGNGQLIQAKNPESRVQYFYDEVGNLKHEHHHDLKMQRTAVWQHLYDELNNRTTTHRPDGQKVDWLLYGSGHVYGLALNGEDSVSFKRDDLHREIGRHYANGISQEQSYDHVGRLTSQVINQGDDAGYQTNSNQNAQTQTKALLKRLYHYDKAGQLTDIHDKRRGHIEYKYDPVGRLLQANSALGQETFAFDPASNIINPNKTNQYQKQDTYYEPTHKHGYNSLVGNVVKDYFDQKYQYDDYGQLIRQMDGGHIQYFEWDALGRLIKSKNDKAETHYRYDPFGRRIEKSKQDSINRNYTETTQYGWDGDTLAFESTHQYTKHYVYEIGSFIPLIQASYRQQINQHQTPTWDNGYDIDKDPLWQTTQKAEKFDRVWFYHCDHLGTPQEMTDQTGAIVWSAEYKAWGECKAKTLVKRDIWDSEIITNNIRFQGQYYDQETGLHYNRYRYYSPYVGRFISKDPIGLLGGYNDYQYAPNPTGWIDSLGLNKNCPLKCPAGTIDPSTVHFMQSSAKNQTGDYTVLGNAVSLKNGTLDANILRAKVWKDGTGKVWTLDHRRLAAFKLAKKCMPITWASAQEVEQQMWKMTTTNGGTSMKLKLGNSQSKVVK
ncbi:RHS repeat-associated core domain-containing protein [Acinetobacter gerneri]|uniref:Uncharacterized protein n=1 Tax=Acinetobacter gerneri DSM 14967 = CIP 107464 = MTCC 9824 TaxID=1120926 RepID=N8Y7V7_9GAMM|nr:RHS repeat-associated core domain-containing protein [Acinetobacter gerneri]ENV32716.1 hypothetical protein F960_03223 [Acinetobacter gerneri DSM 14967 = CIP 107464 = MTCC 9824]EPR80438.1 Rhs family protein [Acinetobacter gerneri DSM 14967 = CIP 107464 = MTCC 9824]